MRLMKNVWKSSLIAVLFCSIAAVGHALTPAPGVVGKQQVVIDAKKSNVEWIGRKVTGSHNGNIKVKQGSLEIEGAKILKGNIDIDMNSMTVVDLTGESNTKLLNHLKSDDFFSVATHPVASFKITSAKEITDPAKGTHEITGDLTIKGVTNAITFPATVTVNGKEAVAKADIKLDRTKWNIRYGSGKFFENLGDKMISDDFELKLHIVGEVK